MEEFDLILKSKTVDTIIENQTQTIAYSCLGGRAIIYKSNVIYVRAGKNPCLQFTTLDKPGNSIISFISKIQRFPNPSIFTFIKPDIRMKNT